MRITLTSPGSQSWEDNIVQVAERPYLDATFVRVPECPACKRKPADIQGKDPEWLDEATCQANAVCLDCGKPVGILQAIIGTLFGLEEDRRVLQLGPWRVY